MSGQVLFHPSHICQIGAVDQGLSIRSQKKTTFIS